MKWLLIFAPILCAAQIHDQVEIRLAPGIPSEAVFVRYALSNGGIGGWIQPRPGQSSIIIDTAQSAVPASRIKALIYTPGCAMRTLDLPLRADTSAEYAFTCSPLPTIAITGVLTRFDRLYGHSVTLEPSYIARWASAFLGIANEIPPAIPVGEPVQLPSDGRFRISIPDLSRDPLAGAPENAGEIEIRATDATTGANIAQLIPSPSYRMRTRLGGLLIQPAYPVDITFAPCSVNPPQIHDANGFARRPAPSDACDR